MSQVSALAPRSGKSTGLPARTRTPYKTEITTAVQMQNAPQRDAFLRSPPPKKREIRLAPPTPNKFASAVININRGTASVRIACGTGMLQNSSSFFFHVKNTSFRPVSGFRYSTAPQNESCHPPPPDSGRRTPAPPAPQIHGLWPEISAGNECFPLLLNENLPAFFLTGL